MAVRGPSQAWTGLLVDVRRRCRQFNVGPLHPTSPDAGAALEVDGPRSRSWPPRGGPSRSSAGSGRLAARASITSIVSPSPCRMCMRIVSVRRNIDCIVRECLQAFFPGLTHFAFLNSQKAAFHPRAISARTHFTSHYNITINSIHLVACFVRGRGSVESRTSSKHSVETTCEFPGFRWTDPPGGLILMTHAACERPSDGRPDRRTARTCVGLSVTARADVDAMEPGGCGAPPDRRRGRTTAGQSGPGRHVVRKPRRPRGSRP